MHDRLRRCSSVSHLAFCVFDERGRFKGWWTWRKRKRQSIRNLLFYCVKAFRQNRMIKKIRRCIAQFEKIMPKSGVCYVCAMNCEPNTIANTSDMQMGDLCSVCYKHISNRFRQSCGVLSDGVVFCFVFAQCSYVRYPKLKSHFSLTHFASSTFAVRSNCVAMQMCARSHWIPWKNIQFFWLIIVWLTHRLIIALENRKK